MEQGGVWRWILIGLAVFFAWTYVPKLLGSKEPELQPIGVGRTETQVYRVGVEPPAKCEIESKRYHAAFSARGAALVDFWLTGDERYTDAGKPLELMSVPGEAPDRFTLRTDFRAMGLTGDDAQVREDVADWTLASSDGRRCVFTFADDRTRLTKTVRAGDGPFELVVTTEVENLTDQKLRHRLGVENTSWRTNAETDSKLGRQSPFASEVACGLDGGKLEKRGPGDFSPKDFGKPEFQSGWRVHDGSVDFAATTNAYFAQALVPLAGGPAACALQIEERWFHERYPDKKDDPNAGAMYRSRLVWPLRELGAHEKASYEVLGYFGPKDRTALAAAAGGQHHLAEIIDLGRFAVIAKVLVGFLTKVHGVVGNWGVSIIVLTLCVKLLLFPLTWKQIKSTLAMRALKPEIDAINAKFADDAQQKQVAMMEAYRKNGVNPFGGCLPVLVQLPVWWALYTTLQTAVELYHTPFLWFRDLSAPDPYFVLPVVIGAVSMVQQRMMPQQADPAQQKMMLYFMPAMFTAMMLFLPSGLGVYMLTNSILGIVQQQAVERIAPAAAPARIEVRDKTADQKRKG